MKISRFFPNPPRIIRLGGVCRRSFAALLFGVATFSGVALKKAVAEKSTTDGVDPYAKVFETFHGPGGAALLNTLESLVRTEKNHLRSMEELINRGVYSPNQPPPRPQGMERALNRIHEPLDLLAEATASPDAWRIDWERLGMEGARGMPTDFRRLIQVTLDFHEWFPEIRGQERLTGDLEALLVMARRFGEAGLSHHYRQALGGEQIVMEWLAANASKLPPETARDLLDMRERLPPRDRIDGVLEREEATVRGRLWRAFSGLGDDDWSDGVDLDSGTLRISSIVRIGREVVIGFETADGKSFTLETGQKRHGFELVMVDLDEGKALVRSGRELLAVYLEPREMGKVDLERAWRRVERYLDGSALMFSLPSAGWLGRRPPEDRFTELLATVKRDYERLRMELRTTTTPPSTAFAIDADFVQSSLPLLISTRQTEVRQRVHENLVYSGIQHLVDPNAPLTCRITGRPISVERSDQEMVLVSPLQHQGEPIRITMPLSP